MAQSLNPRKDVEQLSVTLGTGTTDYHGRPTLGKRYHGSLR